MRIRLTRAKERKLPMRIMTGVTLLELIATLSIATILLTIGVPSFQDVIATNRIATLTNEFSEAFQFARAMASSRGKWVAICKSNNVSKPDKRQIACSPAANWQDGWLIFVDDNEDADRDPEEELLSVGQLLKNAASEIAIDPDGHSGNALRFGPDGEYRTGTGGSANTTIKFCSPTKQRNLVVNRIGRISIKRERDIPVRTCPP